MVAQTVTTRMGKTAVQNLYNLQKEIAGSAPTDMLDNTTTTLTIVFTTSTGAITLDASST
jgi:hypothetical protein